MESKMQTIITAIILLFAWNFTQAQTTYNIEVDEQSPCNITVKQTNPFIIENFLLSEFTWTTKSPNYLYIRDDERTFSVRDNQVSSFSVYDGIYSGPGPYSIDTMVYALQVAKSRCLTRIVGDTLFINGDTLITGGVDGLVNSINGLNDDGTTVKLGGALTENTLITGGGSNFFAVQDLTAGELSSSGQTIVEGGTSLDLRSDVEINLNSSAGNDSEIKLTDRIWQTTFGSVTGDGIGIKLADGLTDTGTPSGSARIASGMLLGDVLGFTRGSAAFVTDTLTLQQARVFAVDGSAFRTYETMFAGMAVENVTGNIAQNVFEFTVFSGDTIANSFMESVTVDEMEALSQVIATNEGADGDATVLISANANIGDSKVVMSSTGVGAGGSDVAVSLQIDQTPLTPDEFNQITMYPFGIMIGNDALSTEYVLPYTRGTNNQILKTDGSGNVTWQNEGGGNIYNTSDTLTDNRIVEGNGNGLRFNNMDFFYLTSPDEVGIIADRFAVEVREYNFSPNPLIPAASSMTMNLENIFLGQDNGVGTRFDFHTPFVETGVAQNGDILTLTDAVNGTTEFQTPNPKIWEGFVSAPLTPKQYRIIELADTSVVIEDSLLRLNGANIMDQQGNVSLTNHKFGTMVTTFNGYPSSLEWQPDSNPINVWANVNPLTNTYKWAGFYGTRETNYSLPGGLVGEQSYASYLNTDGNIWLNGFDWGGGYIINPNNGSVERATDGFGIGGQGNVNPINGLAYTTAISFNSYVVNPQLRKLGLVGYPAFDVSVGLTRFNTGMGGTVSSINNTLYSPPYTESQTTQVAFYDLTNNTGGFLPGNISTTGAGDFAYTTCLEGVDGNVYCMPYNNDYLLEIDPTTNTWIQWGNGNANDTVFATRGGWALINHPNGKMYAPPFVGARTLEIDPVAKTITEIGSTYPSGGANDMKWGSAALHPNGKIYCFPFTDVIGQVLEIDPATGLTAIIPITSTFPYWSATTSLNGSIWGTPAFGNGNLTRLDFEDPWVYPIELVTSPQFRSR